MAKKNLKREVHLQDRNLEVLSLQSMDQPVGSDEGLVYLVMYHSNCFRQFSISMETVTKSSAEDFQALIIPALCKAIKAKREAGDATPAVAVIFEQKVYAMPCSPVGRFPSKLEVKASVQQGAEAICDWA